MPGMRVDGAVDRSNPGQSSDESSIAKRAGTGVTLHNCTISDECFLKAEEM